MWILDRSQIALQRADLMFGSIAEDGSLGPLYSPALTACLHAMMLGLWLILGVIMTHIRPMTHTSIAIRLL